MEVVDGDTVKVVTRPNDMEPWATYSVRIQGCDTPEMHGSTPLEQAAAKAAKAFLWNRVAEGSTGVLTCSKVGTDKFGRLLGDIALPGLPQGVAAGMIQAGFAKVYNGRAKEAWKPQELTAMLASAATSGSGATAGTSKPQELF